MMDVKRLTSGGVRVRTQTSPDGSLTGMAHAYRRFVQHEMDERRWTQADLARAAGLSASLVSRIVTDDQERLTKLPMSETIDGLVRAFGGTANARTRLLLSIAEAMGFPVGEVVVADPSMLGNDELLREVARRMETREAADRPAQVTASPADDRWRRALIAHLLSEPWRDEDLRQAAIEENPGASAETPAGTPPGQSEESTP